ncbi:cobalamin-dependent protein [Streptomyces sp. NPDC006175]|uniref:cobalamin B12-binding domain-containing protein n=1 Tax=unclassified Streptomyces TaxID=2593676 RepID=UPI0033A09889
MNGTAFAGRRLRVVVSGLSSDAHLWNLVHLQLFLEDRGHEVANLGNTTPDATIVEACRTGRPDLLVISTVNGHGRTDGLRLIRTLRAVPSLAHLPAVIGGKLGIDGRDHADADARLRAAGYDAVFDDAAEGGPESGLARFETFLGRLAAGHSRGRPGAGAGAA